MRRDTVTILCYHSVVRAPVPRFVAYGGLHLSAADFARHIRYLKRRHNVIPLASVARATRGEEELPDRAVAITFDDGYRNNVSTAAPILRDSGLRATMFVATGYIGRPELFWWDEVGAILGQAESRRYQGADPWGTLDLTSQGGVVSAIMRARSLLESATLKTRRVRLDQLRHVVFGGVAELYGVDELGTAGWDELGRAADVFDYGGHTAEHRVMDSLTADESEKEASHGRRAVSERLGPRAVPLFSYPAGKHSPAVVEAVRRSGYEMGVTTAHRPRLLRSTIRAADAWRLARIQVTAGMSASLLSLLIAGANATR
jgi:peptidoglycan/xylan/chitin deacetylase (PgdA/CDA1 family)